jgi:predicted  nucleic acid-binding Zn-ribbon protein
VTPRNVTKEEHGRRLVAAFAKTHRRIGELRAELEQLQEKQGRRQRLIAALNLNLLDALDGVAIERKKSG